jgi:hypothetical protein
MNSQDFADKVLDVKLADYQREMLENIPETTVLPAGVPNWAAVRLPFIPVMRQFIAAQQEAFETTLWFVFGATQDDQDQTNEA